MPLPPTVLLVEDNEDDVLLLRRALKEAGLDLELMVVTGRMAVDYLKGSGEYANRERFPAPALVLLALWLRDVSGFDVLSWIRSQSSLKALPVIVLTGSIFDADERRANELGANFFMSKPVDFNELCEGLRGVLRRWLPGASQG